LASIFIAEGWAAIRNPDPTGEAAESLVPSPAAGGENTVTLVRLNGAVQVGGGVLLAIGKFPRLASIALMGTIVPTTYAGHRFWEETDAATRSQQKMQLLKNLGLLGGLIFSAVDTEGAPSVSWRTKRRVSQVADSVSHRHAVADGHAHEAVARAIDSGQQAGRRAKKAAKVAARQANAATLDAVREANEAATSAARSGVAAAGPYLRHANESAIEVAGEALEAAGPYISAGLDRAGELLEEALDAAGPYISASLERAGDLLARVPDRFSDD
jgi:uncharacterized membrane protein YphA (DoxX/SURF4 family)